MCFLHSLGWRPCKVVCPSTVQTTGLTASNTFFCVRACVCMFCSTTHYATISHQPLPTTPQPSTCVAWLQAAPKAQVAVLTMHSVTALMTSQAAPKAQLDVLTMHSVTALMTSQAAAEEPASAATAGTHVTIAPTDETEPSAEEHDAATTIQASYRGHQVRKSVAEEQQAATKIQAGFRGHQVRKVPCSSLSGSHAPPPLATNGQACAWPSSPQGNRARFFDWIFFVCVWWRMPLGCPLSSHGFCHQP
jgi:hypothetical protein